MQLTEQFNIMSMVNGSVKDEIKWNIQLSNMPLSEVDYILFVIFLRKFWIM
jgi:hypothetical protein